MSFDKLVAAWTGIWNGDLSQVDSVVHPDFTSHAAPLTGGPAKDSVGRDNLHTWVSGVHAVVSGLRFTIQVGPLVDNPYVFLRWHAQGTYDGRDIEFHGTDILKIVDDRIAEYWVNADSLWFAQQTGALQTGAQQTGAQQTGALRTGSLQIRQIP